MSSPVIITNEIKQARQKIGGLAMHERFLLDYLHTHPVQAEDL